MDMPGRLVAALRVVTEREWIEYFNALATEKSLQIESTDDDKLTLLKAQIAQIRTIMGEFSSAYQK